MPIDYRVFGAGILATVIHSFTPRMVNELTVGVNRGVQSVMPLNDDSLRRNSRASLGISLPQFYPAANPSGLVPNATFAGVPNAPQLNIDQRYPFLGVNNVWQWFDNISQIVGRHIFKAGIFADESPKRIQLATSFNGVMAFDRDQNNPLDTGYAFANALTGTLSSYTESSGHPSIRARDSNLEWYFQDSLKATRRLTLELGMRFYKIHPTSSPDTQFALFDPATYDPTKQPALVQPYIDPSTNTRVGRDPVSGQVLPAVKIGSFAAGATPFQGMRLVQNEVLKNPPIQLAPRVGVAWDVFGNGRTAVRSGFGISYDRFPQNQMGLLLVTPPLVYTPSANYTTISSLLSSPLSLSPNTAYGIEQNFQPQAIYNWSFGIQQNVGWKTVVDATYIGDGGRHLLQIRNLNATQYGTNFLASSIDPTLTGGRPLPVNFLRPYKGYADIQYQEFAGNSNYHALQAQVSKRMSSSVTFQLSYTWSKVLNVSDTVSSAVNPYLDYRHRNYGPASFDRRQNVALNYVVAVPKISRYWDNPVSRLALDGWQVSGVASFISGAPTPINYTFVTATDVTGASGIGIDSRVTLVCNPNLAAGDRTFARAFDTSCIQAPTRADFGIGNASKYPITGPGVENFDFSLLKNFRLGANESRRAQLRAESYNTLNHAQFTVVDNNARFDATGAQVNRQFGQYTAAAPARRIVLGLKIYF